MTRVALAIAFFAVVITEPALAAGEIVRDDFSVQYGEDVPEAAAVMVADRVEAALKVVRAYLDQAPSFSGPPYSWPMKVVIDPDRFSPYQNGNAIFLPEARVLNLFNGVEGARIDLGIVHEVTHVMAASYAREDRDRFYDDGLAVYLQHRFGSTPNYPDFGRDLYVAVAELASEYGGLVPLLEAEAVRGDRQNRIGRQLAYLQEGAFTQFLIENYGIDDYMRIYQGADPKDITGSTFEELESGWAKLIGAAPTS